MNKKYKYPFYYGFIPQTLADDKDPTDMILLSDKKEINNRVITVDIIAVIPTIDNKEIDDKFICVEHGIDYSDKWLKKKIKRS